MENPKRYSRDELLLLNRQEKLSKFIIVKLFIVSLTKENAYLYKIYPDYKVIENEFVLIL